jgi:type II secretory pathway component PulJ
MKWPVSVRFGSDMRHRTLRTPHAPREVSRSAGYTLIEILVATMLALMLLGAVVRMFAQVGEGITDSRAMLEAADRLRVVQTRLQQDLGGVTVTMNPPCRPEDNAGYFEYIEGPVTSDTARNYVVDSDNGNTQDTTVGDFDDILMFTTRSTGRPFVGRCNGTTVQSDVAEVAWFLRGRTLYRRVLLVAPQVNLAGGPADYYTRYDISARPNAGGMIANTLSDLTRRECRFAHQATPFPHKASLWCWECPNAVTGHPKLTVWNAGTTNPPGTQSLVAAATNPNGYVDFWTNNVAYRPTDFMLATALGLNANNSQRVADDVILTNVIGFDVKAWDPNRGQYVDLGYLDSDYDPTISGNGNGFAHRGTPKSRLNGDAGNTSGVPRTARVYDTWSTHYEAIGLTGVVTNVLPAGNGINGFDDQGQSPCDLTVLINPDGVVDDDNEKITSPPYPIPLRGIQVKIRIFEPDSKQIREVTVVQEFLPQ